MTDEIKTDVLDVEHDAEHDAKVVEHDTSTDGEKLKRKIAKHVCHFGAVAEHPISVTYAIFDALEMHGIIVWISYSLFGAGILAIIYTKFFSDGAGE